ncbi:MAG: transporter substrate-binding domain-containing protein [Pseudomonadota bacterium]
MKKSIRLACAALVGTALCAASVQAKEVKVLFSFALVPYVINTPGQEASGFEYEIMKAALAAKGHTIKPSFVAMGAIPKMLKDGAADGAQRGNPDLREGDGYFYADDATVTYQDVAISLKKSNVSINGVGDLKGKSIVTFQGASNFMGPEFAAAVKDNPNYSELSDEKRKVLQLFAGGVQAYIGDLNVFKYYKAQAAGADTTQEVVIHKVFAPSNLQTNHAVFRDKQLRDDFNAGLKQLKTSGQYKAIVKKYINE